MLVSYEDAQSYRINYTVYYNETEKNETETELIGLFILNDRAYPMRGEKSVENDECEMELTIYMEENTYISVSNETSINENEYEYTYVEDGVVVKDVSMSVSSENGESKTEIELTENGKTVEDVEEYSIGYLTERWKGVYFANQYGDQLPLTQLMQDMYVGVGSYDLLSLC